MVESYLKSLTDKNLPEEDDVEISPFILSMQSGVKIPTDLDIKKERGDHLSEKYKWQTGFFWTQM